MYTLPYHRHEYPCNHRLQSPLLKLSSSISTSKSKSPHFYPPYHSRHRAYSQAIGSATARVDTNERSSSRLNAHDFVLSTIPPKETPLVNVFIPPLSHGDQASDFLKKWNVPGATAAPIGNIQQQITHRHIQQYRTTTISPKPPALSPDNVAVPRWGEIQEHQQHHSTEFGRLPNPRIKNKCGS